jgi:hypothetical protein
MREEDQKLDCINSQIGHISEENINPSCNYIGCLSNYYANSSAIWELKIFPHQISINIIMTWVLNPRIKQLNHKNTCLALYAFTVFSYSTFLAAAFAT